MLATYTKVYDEPGWLAMEHQLKVGNGGTSNSCGRWDGCNTRAFQHQRVPQGNAKVAGAVLFSLQQYNATVICGHEPRPTPEWI